METKMRSTFCSKCGAEAKVEKGQYRFKGTPLKHVMLCGIDLIKCPKCRNVDPIIPSLEDLFSMLAFAVVKKNSRLKGDEIRFLRKYVHMTQAQFGRVVGLDPTTISKYENDDDVIGDQSDKLIRLVAIALGGPGLRARIDETVKQFENISDTPRAGQLQYDGKTGEVQYA
jgi:putative zinc finger/helix-turn-helix YgiT family protein